MDLPILLLFAAAAVALTPRALWLYGEANGAAGVRRLGAVLMVVACCGVTAVSTHFANLAIRLDYTSRLTEGFHRYLLAIDDRLAAGDVDHIRQQLAEVRGGWLQSTPSTSLYLIDLDRRAEAMRDGGK